MIKKLICLAVISLSLCAVSYASNLGDIRSDIRYNILDTTITSNNNRYSDTFLNYRINQAAREIARATLPIYTSKVITPTTSQMEYTVSTDTAKIDKVVYMISSTTDSYKKLTFATIQTLDTEKGSVWEQVADGLPTHYYVRGNVVGLVPPPSATYSIANALKVYYYKSPSDMTADTDIPWDGLYNLVDYHRLIVLSVTMKCKNEKGSDISFDKAEYDMLLLRMQTDLNAVWPDSKVINVFK